VEWAAPSHVATWGRGATATKSARLPWLRDATFLPLSPSLRESAAMKGRGRKAFRRHWPRDAASRGPKTGQLRDHWNTISQRLTLRNLPHEEVKLRVELRKEARQSVVPTSTRRLRTWPRDPSRRSLKLAKRPASDSVAVGFPLARSAKDRLDRLVRRLITRTNIPKNMPSKYARSVSAT